MIDDNALGNRLNEFKERKKHPQSPSQSQLSNKPIISIIETLFTTSILVSKIFVFGYSMKILFYTDWNFWEVACIGLTLNFLLTYIYDLFHRS